MLEVCDAFDGVQFYRDDDPVLDVENADADDHAAICGELVRRLVDRGYALQVEGRRAADLDLPE